MEVSQSKRKFENVDTTVDTKLAKWCPRIKPKYTLMATVRFNLKRPSAKTSTIQCTLTDGREYRIRLYPRISINPKHWSKKNSNVLSADPRAASFNKYLSEYAAKVNEIFLDAKSKGIKPDKEYFEKILAPKEEEKTTFWELWSTYINSKQGIFKKNSFSKLHALKSHLIEFEKHTKAPLHLDTITAETMEDFQNFLYHKKDLNTQSAQKYDSVFRLFLNWCVKRKHTANMDFKHFTAIRQPDSLKVIMTEEDIKKLHKVDLKDKNYLRNVRALFLLACSTGLRYSDLSRINSQHLKQTKEGYILQLRQTKTEDFVNIPLTEKTLQTVNDLISGTLHAVSNQKMNTYVKELCQLAGIDEPFEVHAYKGRQKTTTTVPKYELVTTHTGRRTFATSLLNKGVPAQVVMMFTGHKDYKSFEKYVNIPQETQMNMVRAALEGKQMKEKMWVAS